MKTTLRRSLRLAMALALVFPALAFAQDGGTRSPFAVGAGNRALAMGSAFVAVSDDASGLMWNVAGLGSVQRREVQASQASYFDLDIRETWLGAAWPDWRWGTMSASLRHFGVTGVEARDDRNGVIEGELGDSETEMAIGYARRLGEIWNVGGALKARRQSIAGLSGNGFGFDVGVTARPGLLLASHPDWAQDLTWGLQIGNLVAPSIRLDRENVTDPRTFRTGLAYRKPMFGGKILLTTLDLEKTTTSSTQVHAGMEMQVHPMFALRWGLNDAALTAGTGIRWRDFAMDYVFEDNAFAATHRVGVSYAFGPTVAQSRELSLRAEEKALESKLADAFQKRLADQVEDLLARADERRSQKLWDEALEALAAVQTLQPSNTKAAALEVQCLRDKAAQLEGEGAFADAAIVYGRLLTSVPADTAALAGQRRCQLESDRNAARSEELRMRFARALEAYSSDNLVAARDGFRAVLAQVPDDEEAARMLRRTEDGITRRIESLLKEANRCIQANLLVQAGAILDQAATIDPQARGLAAANTALQRARQNAASRPANDPTASRATEPDRPRFKASEIENLYKRGLEAMKERRSDDALRYFELVWSAKPNYQQVAEYLKREYLMRGMESFAGGKLDAAVGYWEKALQVDPTDARAIGYLARAQKQLARTREILGGAR